MPLLYKSLGWLPLTTVTNQRNIHHFPLFLGEDQYILYTSNIRKMCPENITIPGACRELTPFFKWNILPNGSRMDSTVMQGFTPPKFTKHGHKAPGCLVTSFLFDPPIPQHCMFGPQGDDISRMMIFCNKKLPSLNGVKCHTNAISSPSTLVVPNDEVLRLDWSKGPAGAPWGTPSTRQKKNGELRRCGLKTSNQWRLVELHMHLPCICI